MRLVVADTTPIRYLAEIAYLYLLPRLCEIIFIPSVVYNELQSPSAPRNVRNFLKPAPEWLKIVVAPITHDPVLLALDEGEKAALSLRVSLGQISC